MLLRLNSSEMIHNRTALGTVSRDILQIKLLQLGRKNLVQDEILCSRQA